MKRTNTLKFTAVSCMLLLCLAACKKNNDNEEGTRSFYMGVTPWPANFTVEAVGDAYRFINDHCDMISHHFDEGIPYEEAYRGLSMPDSLRNAVQFRKANTASGKTILLSVAALNLTRHEKADYYNLAKQKDSIVNYWKQLPVNDTKVITAYIQYISYLVDALQPSFVNFGVESNDFNWDPVKFVQYKDFISKVYPALKAKYSAIPFFVSFMVNDSPLALQYATQLLNYTDYITLSAYPYSQLIATNKNSDPKLLPADYFTRFIELAPEKPWGFAETGYVAEDLVIPAFNLNGKGNETWQKDYLDLICGLCNDKKARFLVWFCYKDYDASSELLKSLGLYTDLFGLWEDTGVVDENGKLRPAFDLWVKWMSKRRS
jgi:hypothetical protein